MLKMMFRTLVVICLSICYLSVQQSYAEKQKDFLSRYIELDSLPNITKLVYTSNVSPTWLDENSFYYETRERDGLKVYKVDILKRTKTLWKKNKTKSLADSKKNLVQKTDKTKSPDSNWKAYIKDANVWIKALATQKEYQLSYDGTINDCYTDFYWSPDSKKLAAIKKQDSPMRRIPLIKSTPKEQQQPILEWRNYRKPGDLLPIFRPALFCVETKSKIDLNTGCFEDQYYLSFRKWSSDSKYFVVDYNQRGHLVYQIVNIDAETGKNQVVVNEKMPTFVHYGRNYIHYMNDNKNFIWSSERDGWRHLYLIDAANGNVKKQLTKGEWVVRGVLDIDEEQGSILFYGNGKNEKEDPYHLHYYRMNLDGTNLVDLTPENANHRVSFSSNKEYFVDSYSRPDMPAVSVVRSSKDGRVIMELEKSDISDLLKTRWTMPEVFSAKGRDGKTDIWGTIYRPANFKANKKHPVIEYIYAGPHDAHVTKDFAAYMRFSKLLELGFIVVTIDGMGTANRSKAFHDVCWRNLKDAGFPDRILWMKAAAEKYRALNISDGVGIYGYSAGGQNAMSALLFYPEFYKVGVALCGCHDNRMDKIWWNEQWMGYPIGPWYSESSNTDNAHLLKGKLFLINGELDDNVDPASTLQVIDALVKSDKNFEQLYLPGYGHGLGDHFVCRRVFEFFDRNMQ